ncbi:MAG: CHAT domain-containing protein [Cyanobacteria bacterium P01_D01_bin.156]
MRVILTVGLLMGLTASSIGFSASVLAAEPQSFSAERFNKEGLSEVESLTEEGLRLYYSGQLSDAENTLQLALEKARSQNHPQAQTKALIALAELYNWLERPTRARELAQEALVMFEILEDRLGQSDAFKVLSIAYSGLREYEKSSQALETAYDLNQDIHNHQNDAGHLIQDTKNLLAKAIHFDKQKQFEESQRHLETALSLFQNNQNPTSLQQRFYQAYVLELLAWSHIQQYNFETAHTYLAQSKEISLNISNPSLESRVYFLEGFNYYQNAQIDLAINSCKQALDKAQAAGDRVSQASTLNALAELYRGVGQFHIALGYSSQAAAIWETMLENYQDVTIVNGIATSARLLIINRINLSNRSGSNSNEEDLSNFLELLITPLTLYGRIEDHEGMARTLADIGVLSRQLGEDAGALDMLKRSWELYQELDNDQMENAVLAEIGLVYFRLGQYAEARASLQQVLNQQTGNIRRGTIGKAQYVLGLISLVNEEYPIAEQTLEEAMLTFEAAESDRLTAGDRVSQSNLTSDVYDVLQVTLIAQNKYDKALEILERGRSRILSDILNQRRLSAEAVRESVTSSMDIEQMRQVAIEQQATLVYYSFPFKEYLAIWIIQPDGTISYRTPSVDDIIPKLSGAFRQGNTSTDLETAAELGQVNDLRATVLVTGRSSRLDQANLSIVYDLLIEPIHDLLPQNPEEHVMLVPDEGLETIPFPALLDAEGRHLIETHTLSVIPSIQAFNILQASDNLSFLESSTEELLIVGNPEMPMLPGESATLVQLPGAETEASKIASLLGGDATLRENATESAVLNQIVDAKLIHFATHGFMTWNIAGAKPSDNIEDLSILANEELINLINSPGALAFTPSSGDNGLLTASEISNLRLTADLVVLSACDTGHGLSTSDGLLGLPRSFLSAGASSVVVSLWSIPDMPTTDLMIDFYTNLQQGKTKAQALRHAMLSTMKKHPDPNDWAAFLLIGDYQ